MEQEAMLIRLIGLICSDPRCSLDEVIRQVQRGSVFYRGAQLLQPLSASEEIGIISALRCFLVGEKNTDIRFEMFRPMFGDATDALSVNELLSDEFLASAECLNTANRNFDLAIWCIALILRIRCCAIRNEYIPQRHWIDFVLALSTLELDFREIIQQLRKVVHFVEAW